MANDNDSVDSNGNSTDLKPRRSNRSKGKPVTQVEETDDNIVVNNVAYKVGDFAFYMDKKQDIYRIGLIEEFKFQKRDKLTNKKAEISIKQFYRLDEIPTSVLSNEGEFDTHVMPQNFPDWLRLREIFISDNTLSTPSSSLRGMCIVRHFPDLNHAMALFSTTQSSSLNSSSSPRAEHHSLISGKDANIPVPKQRDDNTFFYVYSYNARGRKLAATYLEIRVGAAYQAELPELHSPSDKASDVNCSLRVWEQLMWKPNQIPEEIFNVYNMATISIACFSGFGGGVDDIASVENGRKISSHMLTRQKALDCLHLAQYNMEKAMEIFAENSLPETNKMPFLWTDEDHTMFDESVKIHGKNFLRINQDKRNKKSRLVGDFVTFYYYWKKNRPKNRKYAAKKNLRSRISNTTLSEQPGGGVDSANPAKQEALTSSECADKQQQQSADKQGGTGTGGDLNSSSPTGGVGIGGPGEPVQEFCTNCKSTLPKIDCNEEKNSSLTERMRSICYKCQHYLRRYGYQRPVEAAAMKRKCSDFDEDGPDFEDEGLNGFDEEEDEEEPECEEDEDEEVFTRTNSPLVATGPATSTTLSAAMTSGGKELADDNSVASKPAGLAQTQQQPNCAAPVTAALVDSNKNTLAINKYDFDEEDENVEEVSSLLKRNQAAKHNILRDTDSTKQSNYKTQNNGGGGGLFSKSSISYSQKQAFNSKSSSFACGSAGGNSVSAAICSSGNSTASQGAKLTSSKPTGGGSSTVLELSNQVVSSGTSKSVKRASMLKGGGGGGGGGGTGAGAGTKASHDNSKKRKVETGDEMIASTRSSAGGLSSGGGGHPGRSSLLGAGATKQIHDSLRSAAVSSSIPPGATGTAMSSAPPGPGAGAGAAAAVASSGPGASFIKKLESKKPPVGGLTGGLGGQAELPSSSQYDSNSSSSSSSSSSNESSSSDEIDSLPLSKLAGVAVSVSGSVTGPPGLTVKLPGVGSGTVAAATLAAATANNKLDATVTMGKEHLKAGGSSSSSGSLDKAGAGSGAPGPGGASSGSGTCKDATKDSAVDSSYSQMITAVPNLPGVCAVTNIGEPMPQMMGNISTDLSNSQSSSVPDLNITVAEPLYKQLSLRNPAVAAAPATVAATSALSLASLAASSSNVSLAAQSLLGSSSLDSSSSATATAGAASSPAMFPTAKQHSGGTVSAANTHQLLPSTTVPISEMGKMVNFNSISCQSRPAVDTSNPEETGLNLVKPKKRVPGAGSDGGAFMGEHNWAPPHDSPSKLVHYRGDSSVGDSLSGSGAGGANSGDAPKIFNGNEVVRSSDFGCIVRTVKLLEGFSCARTDLQHFTTGLKPEEIEKRHQYINSFRLQDSSSTNGVSQNSSFAPPQDQSRQKISSMPPPTEKLHHLSSSVCSSVGASAKHLSTPPQLSHSHPSISSSAINQASSINPVPAAHSRKLGSTPSQSLRSPSPAGNRVQTSFSSGSSNMIRTGHLHNSPLLSNPAGSGPNSIRPQVLMNHNMQPVANNSLLIDYVNMNKVANDILIYQAIAQSYEEMQKQQELQKYLLMTNMQMPNNMLNRALWEQRDRFGSDSWASSLPPGAMHPPNDMSSIMRAITQSQNAANQQQQQQQSQNRPRSATSGLNLSSMSGGGQGLSGQQQQQPAAGGDKASSGSGRASVNHLSSAPGEYPRGPSDGVPDNPDLLESLLRMMTEGQISQGAAMLHMLTAAQHKQGPLHLPQGTPPSAHGLPGGPGGVPGFPGHLGVVPHQALLQPGPQHPQQQQQAVSGPGGKPPTAPLASPSFPSGGPRSNMIDLYQLYQLGAGFGRGQPPR